MPTVTIRASLDAPLARLQTLMREATKLTADAAHVPLGFVTITMQLADTVDTTVAATARPSFLMTSGGEPTPAASVHVLTAQGQLSAEAKGQLAMGLTALFKALGVAPDHSHCRFEESELSDIAIAGNLLKAKV